MEVRPLAIDARELGHVWPGGGRALGGVSFSVAAGEKVALLGANGAGKSTLLRILAGRLRPSEGEVAVAGVAYLPQEVALDPEMTAGETLRLFLTLLGLPESRLAAVVAAFGLAPQLGKLVADLSGGWRRRLDLAIFLLEEKEVLLLDEPASGLDADGERLLFEELTARAARGAAVVVAGHDLYRLSFFTRRALHFVEGRLAREGAPEDFTTELAEAEESPAPAPDSGRGGGRGRGRRR